MEPPRDTNTPTPMEQSEDTDTPKTTMEASSTSAPPAVPYRVFKTTAIYTTFISMGFCGGIVGPVLVHMEYLLHTDTKGMALSFVGENLGYLIGSVLCAAVFDRFNQELQACLLCLWLGLWTMMTPWSPNVYVYYVAMTVANLGNGFLDSAGQSYILHLWKGHRFQEASLQAMHAVWSVGAFTVPYIVIPFLSELPCRKNDSDNKNCMNFSINTAPSYTTAYQVNYTTVRSNATSNDSLLRTTDDLFSNDSNQGTNSTTTDDSVSVGMVRYAFLLVGFTNLIASVLFGVAYCISGPSLWKQKPFKSNKKQENPQNTLERAHENGGLGPEYNKEQNTVKHEDTCNVTRCYNYILYLLIFTFMVSLFWQIYPIGVLISAFVIKGLGWEIYKGPVITSVFRANQGMGRVFGILVTMVLSQATMLLINMTLVVIAAILIVCSPHIQSDVLVWIAVAMLGLGVSTTMGCCILWGAQYLPVTAGYGSMFLAASAVGAMSGSYLAGYLFQQQGHMWLIYLVLSAALLNLVLFGLMTLVARKITGCLATKDTNLETEMQEKEQFLTVHTQEESH